MNKGNNRLFTWLMVPPLALAVFSLFVNIFGTRGAHVPCLFFDILHLECPGCGATRCVLSIVTFRFSDAIKYNALIFILFFSAGAVYIFNLYHVLRYNRTIKLGSGFLIPVAAALIVFWIIRNMPFYPFDLSNIFW